jgi:signal transduction histidine kinase
VSVWPRSLTARILVVEVLAMVVVLVLVPTLVISILHQSVARYQNRLLLSQAREIAGSTRFGHGAVRVSLPPRVADAYTSAYDGRAYAVEDAAGRIVAASRAAGDEPTLNAPREAGPLIFHTPPFVAISLPVRTRTGAYWIVVSQNEARPGVILDDVVDAFIWRSVVAIVAVLILLPLINSLFIRRLVIAIRRTSAHAAKIGPESLHRRLGADDLPAEVVPLVHATNVLLERVERALQQQREFAGNVAHELRTPLATLQAQLDAVDDKAVRNPLKESVAGLSRVISQLADLAALESLGEEKRVDFDLAAAARDAVAELAPRIYAAGDTVELRLPESPVMVRGEPMLVGLALGNLLSNAIRHTPPGTRINVAVAADGSVAVADNGPGVCGEARERMMHRFWRADRRRSDTAGLGLSIVQRILQVHGGRLELSSQPGSGAAFTMHLPEAGKIRS